MSTAEARSAVDAARKAHEAGHDARHAASYATVATALDESTAEVRRAFEANRPARPWRRPAIVAGAGSAPAPAVPSGD